MASKTSRSNFRVEVTPRAPGDFGLAFIGGVNQTEAEWERACESIASDIRRHVDGLPSGGRQGVFVLWDTEKTCEHCGSRWSEASHTYNGGCCDADEANNPEFSAETVTP